MSYVLASLRSRLITLVLLPIIPLVALLVYSVFEHRRLTIAEVQRNALNYANDIANSQEQIINGARQLLIGLAQLPEVRKHDSRACNTLLASILQRFPLYTTLAAAKPNGDVFCSGPALKQPLNISDRPYFQESLQTSDLAISGYLIGRISGKASLAVAYPSLDASGNVHAVIFAGVDIAWLDQIITRMSLPPGSAVTLINRDDTILYRHPDSEQWVGKPAGEPLAKPDKLLAGEGLVAEGIGMDGAPRLFAFSIVRGMPESRAPIVRVGIPSAWAFAEVNRISRRNLAIMALVILVALISAWAFSQQSLVHPIDSLVRATERLAGGDLSVRTGLPYRAGELGQLAEGFDAMADALQTEERQRKQAEEEIRLGLERVRALHDIDVAMTSTLDLKGVLDVLLEKIDLTLPYSATTIRLFNKESGLLEPAACRNLDEQEWKIEKWKPGRGLANAVFEAKRPVMILDAQTDPRVRDQEFYRKHRLVSYLGIPLTAKGENLGVLSFYTKERHEFGDNEIEFLATMASQAAIAIHNAQLYEQTKKLASGLREEAEKLEKANRVKDEFLSVMSHELRTPLNVVVGYSGMMLDGLLGEINQQQKEALQKIINRAADQLTLVNNILYATVLEAEKIKIESHEIDLQDFLHNLNAGYDIPTSRDLIIKFEHPSELPVIRTDGQKLKQILQNLIDNAVKFTEKGTITISARYISEAKAVEFKVADTGIGISKGHLPLIFDKFRQVDSSETRLYGGVGMGLYIVGKFTELLGGTNEVESELGKGSTFTVTIPLSPSSAESERRV